MTLNSNTPRLIIAGTESGVGKTTIATGIMAALKNRGLRVQPFKVGPDYIDPTYHALATGLPSRNLDSWMLSHDAIAELFERAARKADVSVIEGVMGLFDGHSGSDEEGSTAEVAKILSAPVVLIINAGKMARSAAAVALGYARYDPVLDLEGFIINNVGSERHFEWVKEAIEQATSIPVLGYLPKDAQFEMQERHLGLIPTVENVGDRFIEPLCRQIEKTLSLDQLVEIARSAKPVPAHGHVPLLFPINPLLQTVNIAYAWDEAFSFYYQDNLDLLEAYGARLIPFSPLDDKALPLDTQGVYIGGGFPEIYAERLSKNQAMLDSLREAADKCIPIYGECGGLMYLSQGITDFEGNRYQMVGLVPCESIMKNRLTRMGYVEFELNQDTILGSKGMRLRGHEFHWSEMEGQLSSPANRIIHPRTGNEGFVNGNVLASYVHLHFGTDPNLASNFIESCQQWASAR
ncbi:MAG: cobyrinate a,c-diamide synthase [Chloroflexi bacterium]|nr:cobyrinate a,c-diamide synthase [Chloroflexota bacterium]